MARRHDRTRRGRLARGIVVAPAAAAALLLAGCWKVPITPVNAGFELADVSWFEEEETLFIFYQVRAEQGLSQESIVELTYRTDDEERTWTPVGALSNVHNHVPVSCGPNTLCGSVSLHVPAPPRGVGVRLRYHRDGEMSLDAPVTYNAVAAGPAWSNRSYLVYGVFDATNARVQWRGRHRFPTLRNEQAEALGLRRWMSVGGETYGELADDVVAGGGGPYLYGFATECPPTLVPAGLVDPPWTFERAVFDPADLPLAASSSPVVCAVATVTDARGTFSTTAVARKNPEVRQAFPTLRSPIRSDRQLRFLLAPCERTISADHLAMQKQRLFIDGDPDVCIDGWQDAGFAERLAGALGLRVDAERPAGEDMVLSLAVHHDDRSGQLAAKIETALTTVLTPEKGKSSPRVTGAFVFDTFAHTIASADLARLVLWCPAGLPDTNWEAVPDNSQRACPVVTTTPRVTFGPLSLGTVPILPSRPVYLDFIDRFSKGQAGHMRSLSFLAPERTPVSFDFPLGEFGVATFFNDEVLTAATSDAFSYCAQSSGATVPAVFYADAAQVPAPLASLPLYHQSQAAQASYRLGLAWDFPFLLKLEYEASLGGSIGVLSASVAFGISAPAEAYYGAGIWSRGQYDIGDALLQCTRFCDHGTFDSAGVYDPLQTFRQAYANACYLPRFPTPADGGFPRDP